MIHFELGNMIFIRYAVESHRRYLKINRLAGKFERVCLKYFLKAAKAPKSIQGIELMKLHALLFDLNDPLASEDNLDYLDIKSWLKVKIST
jgi:hypothetical protein